MEPSTTAPVVATQHREPDPRQLARWSRLAEILVGCTLAYNAVEAVVAIASGISANSVALIGFGLDSVIEIVAAAALLWRLRLERRGADHGQIEQAERQVHRLVGITFLALALYVLVEAGWTLWTAEAPAASILGIVLASVSLVVMPVIAWAKLRAAAHIGSAALRAEAKETLACSYLSLTLLLGLGGTAVAGWWWADPIAALLMAPWLVREGLEGLSGEGCEAGSAGACGDDAS